MRIRVALASIAVLVLFTGCERVMDILRPEATRPLGDELTWVAATFSGGRQCLPSEPYTPPDLKAILGEARVTVYETRIEHLAVCAACSCPAYAATHYALIKKVDLAKAQDLGFHEGYPRGYLQSGQG